MTTYCEYCNSHPEDTFNKITTIPNTAFRLKVTMNYLSALCLKLIKRVFRGSRY